MLADGQIAGYDEIAAIRGAEPEPAVRRGQHLEFTDRKNLSYGRRYTYVILAGDSQGRIGRPSRRVSVSYAPAPAEPGNLVVEPREGEVRLTWSAPTRLRRRERDHRRAHVRGAPRALGRRGAGAGGRACAEHHLDRLKLENERAYYYAVRALRVVAGTTIYGRSTSRLAATPRDVTPPSAPGNLVAIASEDRPPVLEPQSRA